MAHRAYHTRLAALFAPATRRIFHTHNRRRQIGKGEGRTTPIRTLTVRLSADAGGGTGFICTVGGTTGSLNKR